MSPIVDLGASFTHKSLNFDASQLLNSIKLGSEQNQDLKDRKLSLDKQTSPDAKKKNSLGENTSAYGSPQKARGSFSPKGSASKICKKSVAKLGVEIKNKIEEDRQKEIAAAKASAA